MAELADALDLGSCTVRCKSSTLFKPTILKKYPSTLNRVEGYFFNESKDLKRVESKFCSIKFQEFNFFHSILAKPKWASPP